MQRFGSTNVVQYMEHPPLKSHTSRRNSLSLSEHPWRTLRYLTCGAFHQRYLEGFRSPFLCSCSAEPPLGVDPQRYPTPSPGELPSHFSQRERRQGQIRQTKHPGRRVVMHWSCTSDVPLMDASVQGNHRRLDSPLPSPPARLKPRMIGNLASHSMMKSS